MVYVCLADGFEELEALAPVDLLRRAGIEVQTVGVPTRTVTGAHGIPVVADVALADWEPRDMQCLVLPGGLPGTTNLEQTPMVQAALDRAVAEGALVAAICAAPSILGHKGLLCGRRATCYPGFESALQGATLAAEPVVVDGSFVTARGAGVATEFGLQLVALLCGADKAAALREGMQCR